MSVAFKRAIAMMALVREVMRITSVAEREKKLSDIGPYVSRGKGRGAPSRRYGNKPGKYVPHQGKRELARRIRQAARSST